MATLNYSQRLKNLENRKFNKELNESAVSDSFGRIDIPENVKYMIESMRPIDQKYNSKTLEAADRVRTHLEANFKLHFGRDYRTQGSVKTGTNIKVHSDFDLLTIISRYHYTAPDLPVTSPYTESDPKLDIEELREQATKIMKNTYDEVDTSGAKCITIKNKFLNRRVDIVFAYWYNTVDYEKAWNEFYRGIQLYDFNSKEKIVDYPFAHMDNVNWKGANTSDGSKRGIRLLKNLKADSEKTISLTSFQITSIIHAIDNPEITYSTGSEWKIAKAISTELGLLLEIPDRRKKVKSPNGTENPLSSDSVVAEIRKLKGDLDELLIDTANEFASLSVKRSILSY